jgi:hypothetical protein
VGDYTIVVHSTGDEPLAGAEVLLLNGRRKQLGVTDEVGILRFQSTELPVLERGVVFVCKAGYYCAGWPLDEGHFASDRQWLYIELAPQVVR